LHGVQGERRLGLDPEGAPRERILDLLRGRVSLDAEPMVMGKDCGAFPLEFLESLRGGRRDWRREIERPR
jgi:hypothetical protein